MTEMAATVADGVRPLGSAVGVAVVDHNAAGPDRRRRTARRLLVCVAIAWSVWNWRGLTAVRHEIGQVPWLLLLVVVSEVVFCVGLVLMLVGIGKGLSEMGTRGVWAQVKRRRLTLAQMGQRDATSRLFLVGLTLNWFGAAMTTGLIPLAVIILFLPVRNWPLAVIPVVDLLATGVIRWSLFLPRTEVAR